MTLLPLVTCCSSRFEFGLVIAIGPRLRHAAKFNGSGFDPTANPSTDRASSMEHARGLSPAPATGTDIAVELEHSIGFAGAVFDGQHYHPNGRDYVYSAGACVGELCFDTLAALHKHFIIFTHAVICDFTDPHNQHFLRGHNGNVTCLALSPSVRGCMDVLFVKYLSYSSMVSHRVDCSLLAKTAKTRTRSFGISTRRSSCTGS